MANKQQEFMLGREKGFRYAINELNRHGIEYLEHDIAFRKGTGINGDLEAEDVMLVKYDNEKNCMYETIIIMGLNVLHDKCGIGTKRALRIVDAWNKECMELDKQDYHGWFDKRNEIVQRLQIKKFRFSNKPYDARIKPYDEGRISGMEYILNLAKQGKFDEIKQKQASMSRVVPITRKLQQQSERITEALKQLHYDVLLLSFVDIIHKLLGYGDIRMTRMLAEWEEKMMYLDPLYQGDLLDSCHITWDDLVWVIQEELKINLPTQYMKIQGLSKEA